MRDRLIELIESTRYWGSGTSEEIADYLLANGVIVPPCKVGDALYYLSGKEIHTGIVKKFSVIPSENWHVVLCESKNILTGFKQLAYWMFGKTVFLTKEEAEKALKGGAE